jgi:hypothetical protein
MRSISLRHLFAATVLLLAVEAPRLGAQALTAGTRIRVRGTEMVAPLVGSYQTVRNDTLVVLEDGIAAQIWSLPVSDVRSFEVSKGLGRRDPGKMRRWGIIGGLAGVGLGFVVSKVLDANSGPTANYNVGLGALVGGAAGIGAGIFYGASVPVEKWGNVPVPRRMGAVTTPGTSYAGIRVGF